ncbi:MAG: hypothetical protein M1827_000028 [Pycnora praestabilis]|nr:MAG: hypothetical protein M1827_000028 [Pycnora praestabilis]
MDVTGHRKVDLQSASDLHYLTSNVSRAAREKIDLHLPPSAAPEGEDALRRRVEELIQQYIRTTFSNARESITVNGLDAKSLSDPSSQEPEEFEPYDARLASRVQTLYSALESETLRVTALRREAPSLASSTFISSFTSQSAAEDVAVRQREDRILKKGKGDDDNDKGGGGGSDSDTNNSDAVLDMGRLERWDEVEEMYGRGVEGLGRLRGGMTETAARLERAARAVGYVEGGS